MQKSERKSNQESMWESERKRNLLKRIRKKCTGVIALVLSVTLLTGQVIPAGAAYEQEPENVETNRSEEAKKYADSLEEEEAEEYKYSPESEEDEEFDISLEAEEAFLENGAQAGKCDDASGGLFVKYIGTDGSSKPNGLVAFQEVKVPKSGRYLLRIHYASGSGDRYFDAEINGVMYKASCPSSGGFDKIGTLDMEIELKQGNNKLIFGCSGWYAPNLDRIEILTAPKEEPGIQITGRITLEAEDGVLSNGAAADLNSGSCSGNGKVSNIGGDTNGTVTFSGLEAKKAGTYALDIAACAKEERNFDITVNGEEIRVPLKASADWDMPNNRVIVIGLNAGVNEISFSNGAGYAPNLDKIDLYPCEAFEQGGNTLIYDTENGVYSIDSSGRTIVRDAYAAVKIEDQISCTYQYKHRIISSSENQDSFGSGTLVSVRSEEPGLPVLTQEFYLYPDSSALLTKVSVSDEAGGIVKTNWISPLSADSPGAVENTVSGKDYFLEVPFDNDGWVAFETANVNGRGSSYEAACLFNNEGNSAQGLVIGSVTHDTWKTGIDFKGSGSQINTLQVYGGANSALTRDQTPHGLVSGTSVESPLIYIGLHDNWQEGMEDFARANTKIVPRKTPFTGKVPFGWNSWGSIQDSVDVDQAKGISDYIAEHFQDAWKEDEDDVVYVNLDSYWDNLTDAELKEFADHCKANGQKAGIYWGPFVSWFDQKMLETTYVENSDHVLYKDIILKKQDGSQYGNQLDGAYPIDLTHPAAKARVDYFINRFKAAGFEYIKLDFLGHGSLEGQRYNPDVETGIQAYNEGMQYIVDRLDGQMFINLSIAPTFPYQYADGKRIACDAYYSIGNTEYTLNGLTYGFWQKELYEYPDPDHLVVWGKDGKATPEEARSRITSGILLGTSFLTGDNFIAPKAGNGTAEEARQRFQEVLTNPGIIQAAKSGKIFHPWTLEPGRRASDTFMMRDQDRVYIAVLNYGGAAVERSIDLQQFYTECTDYVVKELWSGETLQPGGTELTFTLSGKDAKVFLLEPSETEPPETELPTTAKAKIKVPKTKLKAYKTTLKNKGQKRTVKITG